MLFGFVGDGQVAVLMVQSDDREAAVKTLRQDGVKYLLIAGDAWKKDPDQPDVRIGELLFAMLLWDDGTVELEAYPYSRGEDSEEIVWEEPIKHLGVIRGTMYEEAWSHGRGVS